MASLLDDWTLRAACSSSPVDYWHPSDESTARELAISFATGRLWCLGCPVQVECARYGIQLLNDGPVEGMYGGLKPPELRSLARQLGRSSRKMAEHGTRTCYVNNGCRRPECKAANARYESERRRGTAA